MTSIYEGLDTQGRLILKPGYGAAMVALYDKNQWPLEAGSREWLMGRRGKAFDSAFAEDDMPLLPNSGERNYPELTAAYEKRLRGDEHSEPGYERVNGDFEGRSETTRQLGNEFRLKMVRTPQEQESMLKDFCKARGWDSDDPIARTNFELDLYYRDRLTGERS